MGLEDQTIVDAAGIDRDSGLVVLTIADAWTWEDEEEHLSALQRKLNRYFQFVESGQVWESYPNVERSQVIIDVVTRFPLSDRGNQLLVAVQAIADTLHISIRNRTVTNPGR